MNFSCVRVYVDRLGSGKRMVSLSTMRQNEFYKDDWLKYNKKFRPLDALLVNGECVYVGGFSKEYVESFEKILLENPEKFWTKKFHELLVPNLVTMGDKNVT